MFTVKLSKTVERDGEQYVSTKLVEALEVNVYTGAPREWCEVAVIFSRTDGDNAAFYIADPKKPRPQSFADFVDFYDVAYIENARGATTEIVRP